jgi:hypothetical protein
MTKEGPNKLKCAQMKKLTYQSEALRDILMLVPSNRSMNRGIVDAFPRRVT